MNRTNSNCEGCIHMGISGCCRYCNSEKECKNNINYEYKDMYINKTIQ